MSSKPRFARLELRRDELQLIIEALVLLYEQRHPVPDFRNDAPLPAKAIPVMRVYELVVHAGQSL